MKIVFLCLLIFTAGLNFSCRQKIESSPITENEKIGETPQTSPTPEKYKTIDLTEQFSRMGMGNKPTSLKFDGYQIKPIIVKKSERDTGVANYDAILSKNGKTIARFEGDDNPMGNFMSFGAYSFLGTSEKQLLVVDKSFRQGQNWIVSLTPKYKVVFDSGDYGIWERGLRGGVDIDDDGVYELSLSQSNDLNLRLARNQYPWVEVVFKYDAKTRQYLPANHLYHDYSLENIQADIKECENDKANERCDSLSIMLGYFYLGKDEEAWKIWDENVSPNYSFFLSGRNKEQTREIIQNALNQDPIYKFVKADLKKNN